MNAVTVPAELPPPLPKGGSIVARDFPGWLPPMLVKELRQGLRTRGFVSTLVGFQVVMLVLTLFALGAQNMASGGAGAGPVTSRFFWIVIAFQLILVTPSRAFGGLHLEVEARTLDLLMLTRLTAWRVVLGKWISLLAQAALLLIAMAPYLVVRYFTDNANLVEDVERCLVMFGFCAVLTAAGLWGSGVAKLLRGVLTVLVGFVIVNLGGMAGLAFGGGGPAMPRSPLANLINLPFDILNAVLLTAFFLVSAVRKIAPPAENHSLFVRMVPVLALLPAPIAEAFGAHALAARQLTLAAVFLGFVLMSEMASDRRPMPAHWREWALRGPLSRLIGRLALPDWPSAFAFGTVFGALWATVAVVVLSGSTPASREQALHVAWLAVLAYSGVTFPAVVHSFLRPGLLPRATVYFTVLAGLALLAGGAFWLAESRWKITEFKSLMEAMPFSSFLFALGQAKKVDTGWAGQAVVVALVFTAAVWRSWPYWRQLAAFGARDRAGALQK